MNILFISNDPLLFTDASGVRLRMRTYAAEVAAQGGVLHILSRAPQTVTITEGPLILHGMAVGKIAALWKMVAYARGLILKEDIDVVSAQDPFEHGWIARRAIKNTNAKLHIQIHTDLYSPWFTRIEFFSFTPIHVPLLNCLRVALAAGTLRKAHGIRVVSLRIRTSIVERFGDSVSDPSVIPIAITHVHPGVVALPHQSEHSLIAVGRLEAEKRIQDLITVIAMVKSTFPDVTLYIVGEGRMKQKLVRFASAKGVEDSVVFLGARSDAQGLMQSASALVHAGAYEGYGLVLVEAARLQVPLITTNVGVVGEVLRDSDVLISPIANTKEFAQQVITCLTNPTEANHRALVCAEHVETYLQNTDSSAKAIISDMARLI